MTLSEFDITVAPKRDWIARGLTERRFRTLVNTGALVRVRHGVYAVAEASALADSDPARQHALLATAAIRAGHHNADRHNTVAVSHESAALLHYFDQLNPPDGVVTLTRDPLSSRTRARAGIKYRGAALPSAHLTWRFDVPVTSAARTVADIARTSPFMTAVVVADCAIHRLETSKRKITEVLDFCSGWPGASKARRVLAFSNGWSESVLESCARVIFARYGLPPPRLQIAFDGADYSYRVDFYWPDYDTVAEADGLMKYDASPQLAKRQLRRDRMLRQHGLKVVHFTWHDIFDTPDRVVAWIKTAFRHTSPY